MYRGSGNGAVEYTSLGMSPAFQQAFVLKGQSSRNKGSDNGAVEHTCHPVACRDLQLIDLLRIESLLANRPSWPLCSKIDREQGQL